MRSTNEVHHEVHDENDYTYLVEASSRQKVTGGPKQCQTERERERASSSHQPLYRTPPLTVPSFSTKLLNHRSVNSSTRSQLVISPIPFFAKPSDPPLVHLQHLLTSY